MKKEKDIELIKDWIMKELFVDINNQCIIDIYLNDNKGNMSNNCSISNISMNFLASEKGELLSEYEKGKILFFRKYAYEKILNDYLAGLYNVDFAEMNMFPSEEKLRELEKKRLECEKERGIINHIADYSWEKTVKIRRIIYKAELDGKTIELQMTENSSKDEGTVRNYTLKYGKNDFIIEYDGDELVQKIEKTHPKRNKAESIIVVTHTQNSNTKDVKEEKKEKRKERRQYESFIETKKRYIKKLAKDYEIEQQEVENCASYYQNKCLNKIENMSCKLQNRPCTVFYLDCPYNQEFVNMLKKEAKKKLQFMPETISMIAQKYNTTEHNVKCIMGTFKGRCPHRAGESCSYEKVVSLNCSLQNCDCVFYDEFIACMKKHSEKNLRRQKNSHQKPQINEKNISNRNEPTLQEIGLKDFVVRANVFKCMNNKHKIDNVSAMINIDNDGKKQQIKISAGYCSQCKVYFIMDSTYQGLKSKGIILCRVSDEKNYLKSGYMNGNHLAQESILMQYGYNVSQIEGLSSTRRQKILAVIIDNKIMSKSEIISYLDFFISQRSSRSNMGIAISKWETDREFVENYKIGEYTQFGVKAIYRR